MNDSSPEILWCQLGGALQMLENAILACPDDVWGDELKENQFLFLAYHTLIWTDHYASENTRGFAPPVPFVLGDILIGHLPERPYTRP